MPPHSSTVVQRKCDYTLNFLFACYYLITAATSNLSVAGANSASCVPNMGVTGWVKQIFNLKCQKVVKFLVSACNVSQLISTGNRTPSLKTFLVTLMFSEVISFYCFALQSLHEYANVYYQHILHDNNLFFFSVRAKGSASHWHFVDGLSTITVFYRFLSRWNVCSVRCRCFIAHFVFIFVTNTAASTMLRVFITFSLFYSP